MRPGLVEDPEPGVPRHGCLYHATEAMDACFFRHGVVPRLSDTQQAMVRFQLGSLAGVPVTCFPTSPCARFDAKAFLVLPLAPSHCPPPLAGVAVRFWPPSTLLGRRGSAAESAILRYFGRAEPVHERDGEGPRHRDTTQE